jgi:RNA polymerase sigma factor (sigma-70 family)
MIRLRRTTVGRDLERLLRDGVRPARGDAYWLDRYLVERDETAFETLVERHGPMVLSLCRRYLRDPRDVEDAFQATFLILVRKGPGLRDASSLSSWLYGVAYRVAMRSRSNLLKRRAREIQTDAILQAPARPTNPPDDALETLDAELSRLPEKYRAPLILCYLEGRTHDQAAAELGWPVGTVRSRMAKARAILARRLSRRGLDAPASLALLRPDPVVGALPPSLVQATLGASLTSTSWPATALAQGVLATMMISQLKWIGLGTAAVGLLAATAGMGAWAVNAPAGPQDAPKTTETKPAADRPNPTTPPGGSIVKADPQPSAEPPDVQTRLTEMERKIDLLTELLHRVEQASTNVRIMRPTLGLPVPGSSPLTRRTPVASVPSPTPAPSPEAPAASAVEPPAPAARRPGPASSPLPVDEASPENLTQYVLTDRDRSGLRVIQAQLQNLHERYKRKKSLHERGEISAEEYFVPIELARILVARLQEMDDDLNPQITEAEMKANEATKWLADLRERVLQAKDLVKQHGEEQAPKKPLTVQDIYNAKDLIGKSIMYDEESAKKVARTDLAVSQLLGKRGRIKAVIHWAETHFDDLKLGELP